MIPYAGGDLLPDHMRRNRWGCSPASEKFRRRKNIGGKRIVERTGHQPRHFVRHFQHTAIGGSRIDYGVGRFVNDRLTLERGIRPANAITGVRKLEVLKAIEY